MWKRKNNTYVEKKTNRAFQLELLVSQTRLVAIRSDPNRLIETCVQQIYNTPIHAKPENVEKIVLATIALHNHLRQTDNASYCPYGLMVS